MMGDSMSKELDAAKHAAREAGRIITDHFDSGTTIHRKESHNLVSDADYAAEEAIVPVLRDTFPSHSFYGEEAHKDSIDSDSLWLIDPLDGTNNFAHRFPFFCSSVAFAAAGELVLGVVYDPVRDELFWAERGQGAYCNNRRVRVSTAASLSESLLATGFYYDRGELLKQTLGAVHALFHAGIHGVRRTGSAALDLCYLGCGRLDAFFEYKLMPWDFGAGAVFVREADGRATDSYGADLTAKSGDVVCSNGCVHDDLLRHVASHRPEAGTF